MPLGVYIEFVDTNDFTLLRKGKPWFKLEQKACELFEDRLVEITGYSPDFVEMLRCRIRILSLQLEQDKEGRSFNEALINKEIQELEVMRNRAGKSDIYETLASVESMLGYQLNKHKTTVKEFYKNISYLKKVKK
jgi:hypothetical protein